MLVIKFYELRIWYFIGNWNKYGKVKAEYEIINDNIERNNYARVIGI